MENSVHFEAPGSVTDEATDTRYRQFFVGSLGNTIMKFAVYGAGGVGGYFGGRLAQAGHEVHLIARGSHLNALRENGLTVESVRGDFHVDCPATDDPAEIGEVDYVLFCVKSFDTESAAARLEPLIGEETAVLSLQNGVDNEEILADRIGEEHTMGGVAYVFATIKESGVVEHTGGPAKILFGELAESASGGRANPNERSERAEALLAACEDVEGMSGAITENVWATLWDKFALICAQAGMTATTRLPLGPIRDSEESWAMYRQILEEVVSVARADGVDFYWDPVEKWTKAMSDGGGENYSSLHYDLTHGKRMELEGLHGSVVRRAEDGTVPATEAVYAILKPWAEKHEREYELT